MTNIALTEDVIDSTSSALGSEADHSFEVEHLPFLSRQAVSSWIVGRLSLLGRANMFQGSAESVYSPDLGLIVDNTSNISSEDFLGKVSETCSFLRNGFSIERDEWFHCLIPEDPTTLPPDLGMLRPFFGAFETVNFIDNHLFSLIQEFALGVGGTRPDNEVVAMAARIVHAVHKFAIGPHVMVDGEGGDLDFHLRLANGLLVMANVFPDGAIDASVYDDSRGPPVKVVKRMRRNTTSERDLISLFRDSLNACTP
jgi:hypothetical protein